MNALKHLFLLAICTLAGAVPASAQDGGSVALNEQFNDVNSLNGWTLNNASVPAGLSWFQGNPGVFEAHRGAPDAYVAASFLSAQNGVGVIDNWLITPQLSLFGPSTLSFFARGAQLAGYPDMLEVRFGTNGDFSTVLATLGPDGSNGGLGNSWQQHSATVDFTGTGQFAFRYLGDAARSNYIGLDTVSVTTVPEPSSWLLYLGGMLTLIAFGRRQPRSPHFCAPIHPLPR